MEKCEPINSRAIPVSNRSLLFFYLAPYALYVSIPMVTESRELAYALRLLFVPCLILFFWKKYIPLKGPKSWATSIAIGGITGLFGCALWVALTLPFAPSDAAPPWTTTAFVLRLAAATLTVPIFEELLIRGYLFRLVLQWQESKKKGSHSPLSETLDHCNIATVESGAWSISAILITTLLFASGHQLFEWPAAMGYGVLLSALWIVRKDMASLISAHAVTNLCLGLYVYTTGHWVIW